MIRTSHRSLIMDGSIKMWLTDAINAVKVIMNVLVPTAVLSYIPGNAVNITIIMPLPVSHKSSFKADGQSEEQRNHYSCEVHPVKSSFLSFDATSLSCVSGFTRKRMHMKNVRNNENPPRITLSASHITKLPTTHMLRMQAFIIHPRFRSMLLCFIYPRCNGRSEDVRSQYNGGRLI